MDVVEFLNARLDEDEAAAKAVTGSCYAAVAPMKTAAHIARHDPARVLREVEAKRAIIAAHGPDPLNHFGSPRSPLCLVCLTNREGYEELWEADPWPCLTLRAIAAVWSDHPDYQPEWKS